jgi:hypothetical protein
VHNTVPYRRSVAVWTVMGVLGWSSTAVAQAVRGQARAAQTTVAGPSGPTTTALADTGTLGDSSDARQASQLNGNVPSVLTGGSLHATTIGWPDEVDSEASLADVALTVAGSTIGADFVMARARAVTGAVGAAVNVDGLSINGVPIAVSGSPNQVIVIPGGQVVINEQQASTTTVVVNALHVTVDGVADVVVASATAGIQ